MEQSDRPPLRAIPQLCVQPATAWATQHHPIHQLPAELLFKLMYDKYYQNSTWSTLVSVYSTWRDMAA